MTDQNDVLLRLADDEQVTERRHFWNLNRRSRPRTTNNRDCSVEQQRDTVDYDGDNHCAVLLQMHGSVWGRVLPWCGATCSLTAAVIALRSWHVVDLTVRSSTGHTFMSLLVSFLLVTRATITYNRFMEARQHLSDLYRSSREIVTYACVLTLTNTGTRAVQWRRELAYRAIVCLHMAQAAVEYRSKGKTAWDALTNTASQDWDDDHRQEASQLDQSDSRLLLTDADEEYNVQDTHAGTKPAVPVSSAFGTRVDSVAALRDMSHGPRTPADENFRAPIVWAFNVRKQILLTRTDSSILTARPLHVNEELKILASVAEFVQAYHGHRKLITTPFPFPLVQMARTVLFFWVFSLPLVLVAASDDDPETVGYTLRDTIEVLLIMFFCTYGFLGLEYVSVELDDPYGNDPNDFPGQRWSALVFEDIYMTIYQTDGLESARALHTRVSERLSRGSALESFHSNWTGDASYATLNIN